MADAEAVADAPSAAIEAGSNHHDALPIAAGDETRTRTNEQAHELVQPGVSGDHAMVESFLNRRAVLSSFITEVMNDTAPTPDQRVAVMPPPPSGVRCTLRTWQLAPGASAPVCTAVCSGHTDAVDSVQACPVASQDTALFASASWDTTVKLWEAPLVVREAAREPTTVLPKASMDGHTQAVSCLCWRQGGTIYRCAQSLRSRPPRLR